MEKRIRWDSFDIIKAFVAFCAIAVHIKFYGDAGWYFAAWCRIVVPSFMMISGFFYNKAVEKNKQVDQIKKIIKLIIWSNLLYFVWGIFTSYLEGTPINEYIHSMFNMKTLFEFLVFNVSPFRIHLWYLNALLYVLVIFLLFKNLSKNNKAMTIITVLLFLANFAVGIFSSFIFGETLPRYFISNFWAMAFPYFSIGIIISNNQDKIVPKLNKWVMFGFVCLFSATVLLERYLFGYDAENYISTIFLSISLFLFFMSVNDCDFWGKKLICKIGRDYSTLIYIHHMIVIFLVGAVVSKLGLNGIYKYVAPIVVYIATVVIIWIWFEIKKIFKKIKS